MPRDSRIYRREVLVIIVIRMQIAHLCTFPKTTEVIFEIPLTPKKTFLTLVSTNKISTMKTLEANSQVKMNKARITKALLYKTRILTQVTQKFNHSYSHIEKRRQEVEDELTQERIRRSSLEKELQKKDYELLRS